MSPLSARIEIVTRVAASSRYPIIACVFFFFIILNFYYENLQSVNFARAHVSLIRVYIYFTVSSLLSFLCVN